MGKDKFWKKKKAEKWDSSSEPPPPPAPDTAGKPPLFVYNYNPKNSNYRAEDVKFDWAQMNHPKGNEVLEHAKQIINFAADKDNYLKLRTDGTSLEDHIYNDHAISLDKINGGEHNGKLTVPNNLSSEQMGEYKKAITSIYVGYWSHIAKSIDINSRLEAAQKNRSPEGVIEGNRLLKGALGGKSLKGKRLLQGTLGHFKGGNMDNLNITDSSILQEATKNVIHGLKEGPIRDNFEGQLNNVVGLNANLNKINGNATLNSVFLIKAQNRG